jgi:4-amino-4-deoxy-L-arabinose transferase-like glycosyltransferase
MRLPRSEGARWALVVAFGALALAAINLWWVAEYRHGYPFNVDEAGYTTIGLVDYFGLRGEGIGGWWDAVQAQAPVAPLVPAITSLVLVVNAGVLQGFGVLIGFLVLLAFAVYGIGERLAGPRLGALAALAVATSFGAFTFVREYIFALPVAALLAAAVYALLRSEHMQRRRWAIACGVALGLMILARTMAVAFAPGVLAAGLIPILIREREDLLNRLLNLTLAGLTAAAVAATWYVRNWDPVYDYLTGFGYGAQSNYYGEEASVFSWDRWSTVAERMIADDLLVPFAALTFAGLVALGYIAVRRVRDAEDRRATLLGLAASDAFVVAIVFAAGYAALTSSQNGGNGFTFPLTVLLPPLAVIALRRFRVATVPAVVAVALIAALNLAATSTLWDGVAKPRLVKVPGFGELPWVNGIPHAVAAIRYQVPGPDARFDLSDRGWTEADRDLADLLLRLRGPDDTAPVTAFASRHRAISSNSVQLAALAEFQRGIPFAQLNAEPRDSTEIYVEQLRNPEFEPTVLITMDRNTDDFPPLVTQPYAEAAARRLGFQKIRATTLPDGRRMRVWVKQGSEAATALSRRPSPSGGARPRSAPRNRRG